MTKRRPSTPWGKVWYFIWYEDSLASWLVNILLAFLLIKFVVYPLLGLLLGTSLPVVAVVSESMDHGYVWDRCSKTYELCGDEAKQRPKEGDFWSACGSWYEERGLSSADFDDFKFRNGFSKGDIIVLRGKPAAEIEVGDVIVFQSGKPYPIIHRVVAKDDAEGGVVFQTKGDHNDRQIRDAQLNELEVPERVVLGVAAGRIPLLGWVKIALVDIFTPNKC